MRAEPDLSVGPGPVARVRGADGGIVGTGFLVGERYVVTCAHVIDDALGRSRGSETQPKDEIRIDLPFLDRLGLSGTVVAWCAIRPLGALERDPVSDIAVMELAEPVTGGLATRAAMLSRPAVGTGFQTFGFPAGMDNGTEAGGELRMTDAGGWHQLRDVQDHGYFVEAGFSGAPVLGLSPDREGRTRLLGMVVAADIDAERRLAFAIPTATLARAWPLLARPYKELQAFGPEDADLFFGRDTFVDELVSKVARRPFLTVIGPSGSGKSSVVMAGLVPRLREEGGWAVANCRPRRRPLYQLAHAIAMLGMDPEESKGGRHARTEELEKKLRQDPGRILDVVETTLGMLPSASRLLLVIDQFEELFTLGAETTTKSDNDANTRIKSGEETDTEGGDSPSTRIEEFVAVLDAIGRQSRRTPLIHAVATLRADFTSQALKVRALADLMKDADVKLGPMTPAELAQAIEAPAKRFGVAFESGLVPVIVTEMVRSPGGLPLMQFALDRLWQRQRYRELSREDYEAIGGVEGALAEHAEAFWSNCSEADGAGLRRILLRLVRLAPPGEQSADTRAVAVRSEINAEDWPLVRDLVAARLVMTGRDPVSGEETVEVVHEALIRAWPRLRAWLDEDREFGLWRQRLQTYLADHMTRGAILTGDILAEAEAWQTTHCNALNPPETALVLASAEARDQEAEQARYKEQERIKLLEERNAALAETTQRQITWTRRLISVLALLVLALCASAYFWWNAGQQRAQAEAQRDQALVTQSRFLANLSRQRGADGEVETAILLALEAVPSPSSPVSRPLVPEAEAALYQAVMNFQLERRISSGEASLRHIRFSPDGEKLLTVAGHNLMQEWRLEDGIELRRLAGHLGGINSVEYSADGEHILTSSDDGTVRLSGRTADDAETVFEDHEDRVLVANFDAEGGRIVSGSQDNTAKIWDPNSPDWPTTLYGHTDSVVHAFFAPQEGHVFTTSRDGTVRKWHREVTGKFGAVAHGTATGPSHDPAGPFLGIRSESVSADSGHPKFSVRIDGVMPGGAAEEIGLKEGDTILQINNEDYHHGAIDSTTAGSLVSLLIDRDGIKMQLEGRMGWRRDAEISIVAKHQGPVWHAELGRDGTVLATASEDGTVGLWDVVTNRALWSGVANSPVNRVTFAHQNSILLGGTDDGSIHVWNVDDGAKLAILTGHVSAVVYMALSRDSFTLISGSSDGETRLWNLHDYTSTGVISGEGASTVSLDTSFDGLRFATVERGGETSIWRRDSGVIAVLEGHSAPVSGGGFDKTGTNVLAISLDGSALLFQSEDGALIARFEGHSGPLTSWDFHPSEQVLATASADRTARLWSVPDARTLQFLRGHEGTVSQVRFSPDGRLLATRSDDGTVRLWQTAEGQLLHTFFDQDSSSTYVSFSPDSRRLLVFGMDGKVWIWDTSDGKLAAVLEGHSDAIRDVSFDPAGAVLATGSWDSSVKIWSVDTWGLLHNLTGQRYGIESVEFTPDGQGLISGARDGTVYLWDVTTGQRTLTFGHSAPVISTHVRDDGTQLVATTLDGAAHVWDLQTGRQLATYPSADGDLLHAEFDPSGQRILVLAAKPTAQILRHFASIEDLVAYARGAVSRGAFTPEERREYFLDP